MSASSAQITDLSFAQEVFTVTRLNREARFILEGQLGILWVEGEISNFSAPHSGHWYFSLKDAGAQVRCAMFRGQNTKLGFIAKDGLQVLVKARVSLYEPRGDYQLIIEQMEEAGIGKLQRAFEALKKRLADQGLFDAIHKKPLPKFPQKIGIITSPTGAAIRDMLNVLKRRFPSAPIIIYPTLVQGDFAAKQIVQAIEKANQRKECDVLIIARGGGSIEDLWSFNEEIVALAIYKSSLPMISGIGHEIDFTIADFVADVRAPTPSAAAELLTPDKEELLLTLLQIKNRFIGLLQSKLDYAKTQWTWTYKQLKQLHPKHVLREQMQQLDMYEVTLVQAMTRQLEKSQKTVQQYHFRLNACTPILQIHQSQKKLATSWHILTHLIQTNLSQKKQLFTGLVAKINTLSPLTTLQRGYAIVTSTKNPRLLKTVQAIQSGDEVKIRLQDGECQAIVK